MLILLLILVTFAVLGVSSYYKGAIRSAVSLVGLGFAVFLALPLAPLVRPLVPKVGLTDPIWSIVLPPVVVFAVIVLIFLGLSFLVHHKASMHFKYAVDDYTRIRWERLNQRLGLCVGLVAGGIYSLLLGLIIYIFGYPAVQVTGEDSPLLQRMLSTARKELHGSGLDKTLASMDPMPENYYMSSDLVGFLYQNPQVLDRLLLYPAFLALSERPEIVELSNDTDFLNAWQTKAPIIGIAKHPKVQAIINHAEIVGGIKAVDLKDLYNYLKTGKSAKYDEERILGRWYLDVSATLILNRRKNPDMTAAEMGRLKRLYTIFVPRTSLLATPDNQAILKVELTEDAKRIIEAAKAAVQAMAQAAAEGGVAPPTMDARMMERYGLRPRNRPAETETAAPAAPAAAQPLPGIPEFSPLIQGTWSREGARYKVKLADDKGRQIGGDGLAEEDRLLLTMDGRPHVFVR